VKPCDLDFESLNSAVQFSHCLFPGFLERWSGGVRAKIENLRIGSIAETHGFQSIRREKLR
jgi:hypothetical protein